MGKQINLSPIDYEDFGGKPSINSHELIGDQTSTQLGLQDDLKKLSSYDATKIQILYNNKGTLEWSNSINGGTALDI